MELRLHFRAMSMTPVLARVPALSKIFRVAVLSLALQGQGLNANARLASTNEIKQLFDWAIARPERCRFVADIELIEPPAGKDQISNVLARINEASPNQDPRLAAARSNAVARSLSGRRTLQVQEWYSKHLNRLDRTDKGLLSSFTNLPTVNSNRFLETVVNIYDPQFSPYKSYVVNHSLHDALLTRNPEHYALFNLWRVFGLDEPLTFPLTVGLIDFKSLDFNAARSSPDPDSLMSSAKIDPSKLERLRNGSDPVWRIEANDEILDGIPVVRLTLEGKFPSPEQPAPLSSIQVVYWIGQVAGGPICLQAQLTNFTLHSSFFSKRGNFDTNGFPHTWKTSALKGGMTKEVNVVFTEIEPKAAFTDDAVFALHFPSSYTVSDISSGTGILLKSPHLRTRLSPLIKRVSVIVCMALTALIPLALLWFQVRHRKPIR